MMINSQEFTKFKPIHPGEQKWERSSASGFFPSYRITSFGYEEPLQ
jgi:hypothetical protein